MFESLDENKKPNIGKLRYENPKKKEVKFFDPETELTEELWQRIIKYINECRRVGDWGSYLPRVSRENRLSAQI